MINKEFSDYLKSNHAFNNFMQLWVAKYAKMERLGGSIIINNPTEEEKEAIGGLLGKDYSLSNEIKISYTELTRALSKTKFSECDFVVVCELYLGNSIITNKQKKQAEIDAFNEFLNTLLKKYNNTPVYRFLEFALSNQNNLLITLRKAFFDNDSEFIEIVLNALNNLPVYNKEIKTLASFAAQISSDPHYFDDGKTRKLLLDGMYFLLDYEEECNTLEEINLLLYKAGLVKDDLSNHCMIFRINAKMKQGLNHKAWGYFYEHYEMWNVSLYNLQKIDEVFGINRVYIMENPSVFRSMCLKIKKEKLKDIGMLCIEGQPNLCANLLIEKLYMQNIELYYSGDFDPEGILIADKLKRRYPSLNLWHYSKDDYYLSISNIDISKRRLSILNNCVCEELQEICELIMKEKKGGYQELLENRYLKEIDNE